MKILSLTKFYSPIEGGIEKVTKDITESNIKKGMISDVFCANTYPNNQIQTINGARVFRISKLLTFKSTSFCPTMLWQLAKLVSSYDILHVHFPDPMMALSLFIAKPETPVVIHWHSDIIKQAKLKILFKPLQDWCLNQARTIVVTSQAYLDSSQDLLPYHHKVQIVPIGISIDQPPRVREIGDTIKLLAVGRLTYYKGHSYLIEAMNKMPKNYSLTIVGNGELETETRRLIKEMGLCQQVKLKTSLSYDEVLEEFAASDLFCFPSTHKSEAFGVVLIEAMAFSLPIVSCEIPGSGVSWVNSEGVSGLNVRPMDADALVEAILKITVDKDLYRKLSLQSYERYKKEFELSKMMEKIWNIYQSV